MYFFLIYTFYAFFEWTKTHVMIFKCTYDSVLLHLFCRPEYVHFEHVFITKTHFIPWKGVDFPGVFCPVSSVGRYEMDIFAEKHKPSTFLFYL